MAEIGCANRPAEPAPQADSGTSRPGIECSTTPRFDEPIRPMTRSDLDHPRVRPLASILDAGAGLRQ